MTIINASARRIQNPDPDVAIAATLDRLSNDAPHAVAIIERAEARHDELEGARIVNFKRDQELQADLRYWAGNARQMQRVRDKMRKRKEIYQRKNEADIYPRIESWLIAQAGKFRYKPRFMAKVTSVAKAEKDLAANESKRHELGELRKKLESESLTFEEAEAGLEKAINELAAKGEPNLKPLFRVQRDVALHTSRRQFERARQGSVVWPSHVVKGADLEAREYSALPILLNIFKDEILEKLKARLLELQSLDPVSFAERVERINVIDRDLRGLAYEEASLIAFLHSDSKIRIAYRRDMPVECLLGVEVVGQHRADTSWLAGGPEED